MSSKGAEDVMCDDVILDVAINCFSDAVFVRNECCNSSDADARRDGSFTNICDKKWSNRSDA